MSDAAILTRGPRGALLLVAAMSAALMAGCANRDSIVVGAIPDDYRTNHPIVIAEREQTLDIPVGVSEQRLDQGRRSVLAGFLEGYDASGGAPVRIMVPYGSANQVAASRISGQMADVLRAEGVPHHLIRIEAYHVDAPEASAPIRVAYTAMQASVASQCGRWPADIRPDAENRHYANFGCAYQNNLAAQVANPADLLGPRRTTSVDPENRSSAIDQYKNRGVAAAVRGAREIEY